MSTTELLAWGSTAIVLLTAFVLGALPRFAARMIVTLYPKGDPRRDEVFAELVAHAKAQGLKHVPEHWFLLGWTFAAAVQDGIPLRWRKICRERPKFIWREVTYYTEVPSEFQPAPPVRLPVALEELGQQLVGDLFISEVDLTLVRKTRLRGRTIPVLDLVDPDNPGSLLVPGTSLMWPRFRAHR